MKHILTFLFVTFSALALANDSDTTLMTIGDKNISLGEFEYLYHKNNQVAATESNSLEEYIDLFINFKLKVIAAEEAGYDTIPSFVKELSGYRDQLAEPYLKDQDLTEQLLKEAYERLKQEVDASHILIRLKGTSPQDSTVAYQRILEARDKILQGEDFASVAKKYSQDPSVAQNGGHLGYFTGFQMVLPFEDAAFSTPVGEVSMPFTSRFGYHILKVHSKRPSRGEVNVSHILLLCNDRMSDEVKAKKKEEIDAIYQSLQEGEDFAKLAKEYSEDHGSATKGGNIGFIKSGQTIPAFENAAFALQNKGDISTPIKTRFGWHIIRLEDKRQIASFKEMRDDLKRRLSKDERGTKPEKVFINRLKKEYNYSIDQEALQALYKITQTAQTDSTFRAMLKGYTDTIMHYGNEAKTQYDLAQYALETSPDHANFEKAFPNFEKSTLIAYEKSRLEDKYEDFRYLMQEYHDGLLLFEISNEMVWEKASKDEEKLKKFYKKHKKEYRFNDTCYQADIELFKDSTTYAKYQEIKDSMDFKSIEDSLNTGGLNFEVIKGFYHLGDNRAVDDIAYGIGTSPASEKYQVIIENGLWYTKGDIKPFDATRGACISDYQEYLEQKWVKQLRRKHKVRIHKDILSLID